MQLRHARLSQSHVSSKGTDVEMFVRIAFRVYVHIYIIIYIILSILHLNSSNVIRTFCMAIMHRADLRAKIIA